MLWLALALVRATGLAVPGKSLTLFLKAGAFQLEFGLVADALRLSGSVLVLGIAFCVFMFSREYIALDQSAERFTAILSLFVGRMVVLLMSASLPTFLVGWDGLGVTSALLILHYDAKGTNRRCLITFLTNRLGDSLIIAGTVFFLGGGYLGLTKCGA